MNNIMVINMGLKSIRSIIFDQKGLKLGSAALAINKLSTRTKGIEEQHIYE